MDPRQREIVGNALERFSGNLVNIIIRGDYFITVMIPGGTRDQYALVDFQKKMMLNFEQYGIESQELYSKFQEIKRWYKC